MYLTPNQIEVIRVVAAGNSNGSTTDLDEILLRLKYQPTKQALQFTIRSLVKHELIEKVGSEKRRGRQRVVIAATTLGKHFAAANTGTVASAIVEPDDELEPSLD